MENPKVTIHTNNQPRYILTWYDLTQSEQREFEYLDTADKQAVASFIRYKGEVYDLNEFIRCDRDMFGQQRWDGYKSDSFYSGILVRYCSGFESVIVASYIA